MIWNLFKPKDRFSVSDPLALARRGMPGLLGRMAVSRIAKAMREKFGVELDPKRLRKRHEARLETFRAAGALLGRHDRE